MAFKNLVGLFILILFCKCETNTNQPHDVKDQNQHSHSGFTIENSPRRGTTFVDSNGITYVYYNITTIITNDSILPLHLIINFIKEKNRITDSQARKVFLLPRNLETEGIKQCTNEQKIELGLPTNLKWFLDKVEAIPISFDTVIGTKGTCYLNFGILNDIKYAEPYAIGLKTFKDTLPNFTLKLSFDCVPNEHHLIPCGQISFTTKN